MPDPVSELNRWFREPLGDFDPFSRLLPHRGRLHGLFDVDQPLPVDLYQDENNYHARLETPGVTRDRLSLSLEPSGELLIKVMSADSSGDEPEVERYRSLTLPDDVDTDSINARLENGILNLTIARREKPGAVSIEVS